MTSVKIANVIYETELVNHTMVDYINYYKGNTKYSEIDNTLPTLYVGWKFMKASNQDSELLCCAEILTKEIIKSKLYWEFSFSEEKSSHIKGVSAFILDAPKLYFTSNFEYSPIDPVFAEINNIEEFKSKLPLNIEKLYVFMHESAYFMLNGTISGIDLRTYEFFGFNIEEMINVLKGRSVVIIDDFDGETYQKYYKIFPNFRYIRRYLVGIQSN